MYARVPRLKNTVVDCTRGGETAGYNLHMW